MSEEITSNSNLPPPTPPPTPVAPFAPCSLSALNAGAILITALHSVKAQNMTESTLLSRTKYGDDVDNQKEISIQRYPDVTDNKTSNKTDDNATNNNTANNVDSNAATSIAHLNLEVSCWLLLFFVLFC